MNHTQLMAQIDRAKQHTAEMAVASPGIYHQYGDWIAAKKSLEIAKRNMEKAEAAWIAMIKPALSEPLLKELAERKGLVPATQQPAVPEDVACDAKRYRWLRDMASQDWLHRNHNYQNLRGAAFDAAIDAARAAEKGGA